jgi:hypothetical protein
MSIARRSTAAIALSCIFATAAIAQSSQTDALVFEISDLAGSGAMEAHIVETDYDNRTLTVRFESGNKMARLVVPDDAEIVQMGPNNLAERPMRFSDLHSGDQIEVEGVEIDGAVRLRIIGIES